MTETETPTEPATGPEHAGAQESSSASSSAGTEAAPRPPRISGVPADRRRAIVVGASSGIGEALVKRLAGEGYHVVGLARRKDKLEALASDCAEDCARTGGRVQVVEHDVIDTDQVSELFERLVRDLGGLDLIVYAAGIMPAVELDEYDTTKDLEQVAINLEGCIAWCNAAARLFQTQREGTIVGVSSIAGDRGRKGNPVYCTTKAAMATYLEALRNRLSEVGVHVCTIKPGFIDTPMTEGLEGLFWLISADDAAKQILSAARNHVNTRYVPVRWWLVGTIIKLIPSFLFRKLNI